MATASWLTLSSRRSIRAWQSEETDRVVGSAARLIVAGITGTEAIIIGAAKTGIDETTGTGAAERKSF
jgi:hypothetical protein